MITKTQTRNRINQLLTLDNYSDTVSSRYDAELLAYISAHLGRFYLHYADVNGISLQTASQQVNQWDLQQWNDAVNSFNERDWPIPALVRVKAYASAAHINKGHLLMAIVALGLIHETVQNANNIHHRLLLDGRQQVKRLHVLMHTTPREVKKGYSIITDPKTQAIWSPNIWSDTDKLANDVEDLVNKHLRHGMSIHDLDNILERHANPSQFNRNESIADRVKTMDFNARRIVRTESSRLINEVNLTTYRMKGITLVNWIDFPGACKYCEDLASDSPYDINDAPSIPQHPNDRCLYAPANNTYSNLITPNMLF